MDWWARVRTRGWSEQKVVRVVPVALMLSVLVLSGMAPTVGALPGTDGARPLDPTPEGLLDDAQSLADAIPRGLVTPDEVDLFVQTWTDRIEAGALQDRLEGVLDLGPDEPVYEAPQRLELAMALADHLATRPGAPEELASKGMTSEEWARQAMPWLHALIFEPEKARDAWDWVGASQAMPEPEPAAPEVITDGPFTGLTPDQAQLSLEMMYDELMRQKPVEIAVEEWQPAPLTTRPMTIEHTPVQLDPTAAPSRLVIDTPTELPAGPSGLAVDIPATHAWPALTPDAIDLESHSITGPEAPTRADTVGWPRSQDDNPAPVDPEEILVLPALPTLPALPDVSLDVLDPVTSLIPTDLELPDLDLDLVPTLPAYSANTAAADPLDGVVDAAMQTFDLLAIGFYTTCYAMPGEDVRCLAERVPLGTPMLIDVDGDPTTGIGGMDASVLLEVSEIPDGILEEIHYSLTMERLLADTNPLEAEPLPALIYVVKPDSLVEMEMFWGFDARDADTLSDRMVVDARLTGNPTLPHTSLDLFMDISHDNPSNQGDHFVLWDDLSPSELQAPGDINTPTSDYEDGRERLPGNGARVVTSFAPVAATSQIHVERVEDLDCQGHTEAWHSEPVEMDMDWRARSTLTGDSCDVIVDTTGTSDHIDWEHFVDGTAADLDLTSAGPLQGLALDVLVAAGGAAHELSATADATGMGFTTWAATSPDVEALLLASDDTSDTTYFRAFTDSLGVTRWVDLAAVDMPTSYELIVRGDAGGFAWDADAPLAAVDLAYWLRDDAHAGAFHFTEGAGQEVALDVDGPQATFTSLPDSGQLQGWLRSGRDGAPSLPREHLSLIADEQGTAFSLILRGVASIAYNIDTAVDVDLQAAGGRIAYILSDHDPSGVESVIILNAMPQDLTMVASADSWHIDNAATILEATTDSRFGLRNVQAELLEVEAPVLMQHPDGQWDIQAASVDQATMLTLHDGTEVRLYGAASDIVGGIDLLFGDARMQPIRVDGWPDAAPLADGGWDVSGQASEFLALGHNPAPPAKEIYIDLESVGDGGPGSARLVVDDEDADFLAQDVDFSISTVRSSGLELGSVPGDHMIFRLGADDPTLRILPRSVSVSGPVEKLSLHAGDHEPDDVDLIAHAPRSDLLFASLDHDDPARDLHFEGIIDEPPARLTTSINRDELQHTSTDPIHLAQYAYRHGGFIVDAAMDDVTSNLFADWSEQGLLVGQPGSGEVAQIDLLVDGTQEPEDLGLSMHATELVGDFELLITPEVMRVVGDAGTLSARFTLHDVPWILPGNDHVTLNADGTGVGASVDVRGLDSIVLGLVPPIGFESFLRPQEDPFTVDLRTPPVDWFLEVSRIPATMRLTDEPLPSGEDMVDFNDAVDRFQWQASSVIPGWQHAMTLAADGHARNYEVAGMTQSVDIFGDLAVGEAAILTGDTTPPQGLWGSVVEDDASLVHEYIDLASDLRITSTPSKWSFDPSGPVDHIGDVAFVYDPGDAAFERSDVEVLRHAGHTDASLFLAEVEGVDVDFSNSIRLTVDTETALAALGSHIINGPEEWYVQAHGDAPDVELFISDGRSCQQSMGGSLNTFVQEFIHGALELRTHLRGPNGFQEHCYIHEMDDPTELRLQETHTGSIAESSLSANGDAWTDVYTVVLDLQPWDALVDADGLAMGQPAGAVPLGEYSLAARNDLQLGNEPLQQVDLVRDGPGLLAFVDQVEALRALSIAFDPLAGELDTEARLDPLTVGVQRGSDQLVALFTGPQDITFEALDDRSCQTGAQGDLEQILWQWQTSTVQLDAAYDGAFQSQCFAYAASPGLVASQQVLGPMATATTTLGIGDWTMVQDLSDVDDWALAHDSDGATVTQHSSAAAIGSFETWTDNGASFVDADNIAGHHDGSWVSSMIKLTDLRGFDLAYDPIHFEIDSTSGRTDHGYAFLTDADSALGRFDGPAHDVALDAAQGQACQVAANGVLESFTLDHVFTDHALGVELASDGTGFTNHCYRYGYDGAASAGTDQAVTGDITTADITLDMGPWSQVLNLASPDDWDLEFDGSHFAIVQPSGQAPIGTAVLAMDNGAPITNPVGNVDVRKSGSDLSAALAIDDLTDLDVSFASIHMDVGLGAAASTLGLHGLHNAHEFTGEATGSFSQLSVDGDEGGQCLEVAGTLGELVTSYANADSQLTQTLTDATGRSCTEWDLDQAGSGDVGTTHNAGVGGIDFDLSRGSWGFDMDLLAPDDWTATFGPNGLVLTQPGGASPIGSFTGEGSNHGSVSSPAGQHVAFTGDAQRALGAQLDFSIDTSQLWNAKLSTGGCTLCASVGASAPAALDLIGDITPSSGPASLIQGELTGTLDFEGLFSSGDALLTNTGGTDGVLQFLQGASISDLTQVATGGSIYSAAGNAASFGGHFALDAFPSSIELSQSAGEAFVDVASWQSAADSLDAQFDLGGHNIDTALDFDISGSGDFDLGIDASASGDKSVTWDLHSDLGSGSLDLKADVKLATEHGHLELSGVSGDQTEMSVKWQGEKTVFGGDVHVGFDGVVANFGLNGGADYGGGVDFDGVKSSTDMEFSMGQDDGLGPEMSIQTQQEWDLTIMLEVKADLFVGDQGGNNAGVKFAMKFALMDISTDFGVDAGIKGVKFTAGARATIDIHVWIDVHVALNVPLNKDLGAIDMYGHLMMDTSFEVDDFSLFIAGLSDLEVTFAPYTKVDGRFDQFQLGWDKIAFHLGYDVKFGAKLDIPFTDEDPDFRILDFDNTIDLEVDIYFYPFHWKEEQIFDKNLVDIDLRLLKLEVDAEGFRAPTALSGRTLNSVDLQGGTKPYYVFAVPKPVADGLDSASANAGLGVSVSDLVRVMAPLGTFDNGYYGVSVDYDVWVGVDEEICSPTPLDLGCASVTVTLDESDGNLGSLYVGWKDGVKHLKSSYSGRASR